MIKTKALILAAAFFLALAGTAYTQTAKTGKLVGLAVIVEYQDHRTVHTRQQVDEMFNRVGGMRGSNEPISVYDFYKRFSDGRFELTHVVAPVVTLPYTFAQRGDPRSSPSDLWPEVKKVLDNMKFDMRGVTLNSRGEPAFITMLVSGPVSPAGVGGTTTASGGRGHSRTRMSTNRNSNPAVDMRVLLHEIGHALGWPHAAPASALGRCLMKGGWVPNPFYRHMAGWIDPVDITKMPSGTRLTLTANSNQAFVYRRNANEAFYIEARQSDSINGFPIGMSESGLLIWHINEAGSRSNAANATGFWRVELVHANGRSEMGNSNQYALFRQGVRTRFDRATTPSSNWRDGTPSGLNISRISGAGNTISFTLGFENYVDEMLPEVKFLDDIYASAMATSNVVVTLNQNLTLNTLISLPAPRTLGATVTIRSANPNAPVTITRGTVGNLFTVPDRTALILENIIIDGGGRGNFIVYDNDEEGEADESGNVIIAAPPAPQADNNSEGALADGTAAAVPGTLVRVNSGGTLIMNNGAVLRNNINSSDGGGVYIARGGTFTMNGGEISGNTAQTSGGVMLRDGVFTMNNGKISGNTSRDVGGGVRAPIANGVFTMNGGEISGNSGTIGGGVRLSGRAAFTMKGGRISGNTASSDGGGVAIANDGTVFNLNGGEISGNTAGRGSGIRISAGTVNLNGGVVAEEGRNVAAVVSGTHNLNSASPGNAVIIAWNRPSGTLNYTAGSSTHLTVSAGGTASWANQGGSPGISYANGTNTGWIKQLTALPIEIVSLPSVTLPALPIEMVSIPGGTFIMGSPTTDELRESNETQHSVTLTAFYMGKYEVTQEQYLAVMGYNPSMYNGRSGLEPAAGEVQARRPVESVTWFDAVEFCNKLSALEGLNPVYTITSIERARAGTSLHKAGQITGASVTQDLSKNGYRLPTEAEWEYACRAGTTTRFFFGNTAANLGDFAWYGYRDSATVFMGNSGDKTHEVGKKRPNALGLYDMYRNVAEWCWDWYADNPGTASVTNPTGPNSGKMRVLRGSNYESAYGWMSEQEGSPTRYYYYPSSALYSDGFRVVRR